MKNKYLIIGITFMLLVISILIPEYLYSWFPLGGLKLPDIAIIIFMITTALVMVKR